MGDFPRHPTIFGLSKVITSWSSRRTAQVRPAHRAPQKRMYRMERQWKTWGFVWKCWVYSQWNSHLIGIMISKTIGFRGTQHFQTHPRRKAINLMVLDQLPDGASETLGLCSVPRVLNGQGMPALAALHHRRTWKTILRSTNKSWRLGWGSNYPVLLLSEEKHETWNSTKAEWERDNTKIAVCLPSKSCTTRLWPSQNPTLINHSATLFWCGFIQT